MARQISKAYDCDQCGERVAKAESKDGKTFTAEFINWSGDEGGNKTFLKGHRCHEDQVARHADTKAVLLSLGYLVKGQEVVVVKGRKVPLGTTGIIFWTAVDNGFAYGDGTVTRVGFKDAQGTAYFIDAKNVIATNQQVEAK